MNIIKAIQKAEYEQKFISREPEANSVWYHNGVNMVILFINDGKIITEQPAKFDIHQINFDNWKVLTKDEIYKRLNYGITKYAFWKRWYVHRCFINLTKRKRK